jgi:hypothetical protein
MWSCEADTQNSTPESSYPVTQFDIRTEEVSNRLWSRSVRDQIFGILSALLNCIWCTSAQIFPTNLHFIVWHFFRRDTAYCNRSTNLTWQSERYAVRTVRAALCRRLQLFMILTSQLAPDKSTMHNYKLIHMERSGRVLYSLYYTQCSTACSIRQLLGRAVDTTHQGVIRHWHICDEYIYIELQGAAFACWCFA